MNYYPTCHRNQTPPIAILISEVTNYNLREIIHTKILINSITAIINIIQEGWVIIKVGDPLIPILKNKITMNLVINKISRENKFQIYFCLLRRVICENKKLKNYYAIYYISF